MNERKRFFFAADIIAAWPQEFPPAKLINEQFRHMTLAFLGSADPDLLIDFPIPSFHLAVGGYSTNWIFLPRVIAADVHMLSPDLLEYQAELSSWLKSHGYLQHEKRPFFPHITVARRSFDVEQWEEIPCQIPFYISGITLYESLGHSHYKSLWRHPFIPPFEEIEHTADIAFLIRGATLQELGFHAKLALAFKFPPLVSFFRETPFTSLDTIIAHLNQMIAQADQKIGTPLKAVSYHDEMISRSDNLLEWKMIVDV